MSSEVGQRKLAAIMFTDIVGYSAHTQTNEARALDLLENHNRLLRPIFPKYHGREVKTIGDSFLVEFDSALDAVNCAVEIQRILHDHNGSTRDEEKIKIRIGVHLGDIVHRDNDVFGDAVNVASRIEPVAEPGGICISGQVYDQIRNKVTLRLTKLAQRDLKNIQTPVDIYKVVMPWEVVTSHSSSASDTHRIAILPFTNMSPDPADEYFADGLTEELISKLSLVRGLRVIARTSVMKYKNKDKGVSEIGKELGVGYVVEGSVRKAANRIRVASQLVDTKSEEHLWASSYDKNLDDIFAVQDEIASRIAEALHGSIASLQTPVKSRGETRDVTAYSFYLQAKQLFNERSTDSLHRALELFNKATDIDPSFARAYVEAGYCYAYLGMRTYLSYEEAVAGMKSAARKALEIDENLAEVHALLSFIAWIEDDHVVDGREAMKAIELNPNLADAYLRLAFVKFTNGHLDESVQILEKAQILDPLSSEIIENLGLGYFWCGREAEALNLWNRNRRIIPRVIAVTMVEYYLEKKDFQRAEEEIKLLEGLSPGDYSVILHRGELSALKGDRKSAEEAIDKLEKSSGGRAVTDRNVGFIRYYLGDKDAFFDAMFRAVETHVLDPFRLRYSFLLEEARKDPRYREVLEKNGVEVDPKN